MAESKSSLSKFYYQFGAGVFLTLIGVLGVGYGAMIANLLNSGDAQMIALQNGKLLTPEAISNARGLSFISTIGGAAVIVIGIALGVFSIVTRRIARD